MSKTRILIADDHQVVIQGVKTALLEHPEFEVVGEAHDGSQAIQQAKTLEPDVVIMDISMPGINGIEATAQIRKSCPDIRVVIFTMYSDKEYVIELFKAGISAYVLKDDPISDLVLAVKSVRSGGTYFSTMAPTILLRHMESLEERGKHKNHFESLSMREREVFRLLAQGRPIKKIAGELCISPKTVESHKYHIMTKLQISSITDLIKVAIRKNIVKI